MEGPTGAEGLNSVGAVDTSCRGPPPIFWCFGGNLSENERSACDLWGALRIRVEDLRGTSTIFGFRGPRLESSQSSLQTDFILKLS